MPDAGCVTPKIARVGRQAIVWFEDNVSSLNWDELEDTKSKIYSQLAELVYRSMKAAELSEKRGEIVRFRRPDND